MFSFNCLLMKLKSRVGWLGYMWAPKSSHNDLLQQQLQLERLKHCQHHQRMTLRKSMHGRVKVTLLYKIILAIDHSSNQFSSNGQQ